MASRGLAWHSLRVTGVWKDRERGEETAWGCFTVGADMPLRYGDAVSTYGDQAWICPVKGAVISGWFEDGTYRNGNPYHRLVLCAPSERDSGMDIEVAASMLGFLDEDMAAMRRAYPGGDWLHEALTRHGTDRDRLSGSLGEDARRRMDAATAVIAFRRMVPKSLVSDKAYKALLEYCRTESELLRRLSRNPWSLVGRVHRYFRFAQADRVAEHFGISLDAAARRDACIGVALRDIARNDKSTLIAYRVGGHGTNLSYRWLSECRKLSSSYRADADVTLGCDFPRVLDAYVDAIDPSTDRDTLDIKDHKGIDKGRVCKVVTKDGDVFVAPRDEAVAERTFTRVLLAHGDDPVPRGIEGFDIDAGIDEWCRAHNHGNAFDDLQREAVHMILTRGASITTGGPGRGKTTVASCAAYLWHEATGGGVAAFALSGKAASHLCDVLEAAGVPDMCVNGSTIHRYLYARNGDSFVDDGTLCIIDELSCVDSHLMGCLMQRIPNRHVAMLGDVDQLPSIGPGAVLRDLLDSGRLPVTRLMVNHRSEGLDVAASIDAVRDGRLDGVRWGASLDSELRLFDVDDTQASELAIREYLRLADEHSNKSVCLLAPTKRAGGLGVRELNVAVARRLRDSEPVTKVTGRLVYPRGVTVAFTEAAREELVSKGRDRRDVYLASELVNIVPGDRVIMTHNYYDLEKRDGHEHWRHARENVMNGDVGTLVEEGTARGVQYAAIKFDGDDDVTWIDQDMYPDVDLAYALTVHKSQGSEYDHVLVAIPGMMLGSPMAVRNLVYTASSRAKKTLTVFGSYAAFEHCVGTLERRRSTLSERLLDGRIPI